MKSPVITSHTPVPKKCHQEFAHFLQERADVYMVLVCHDSQIYLQLPFNWARPSTPHPASQKKAPTSNTKKKPRFSPLDPQQNTRNTVPQRKQSFRTQHIAISDTSPSPPTPPIIIHITATPPCKHTKRKKDAIHVYDYCKPRNCARIRGAKRQKTR